LTVAVVHRPGLDYDRAHPYGAPGPVYEAIEALFRSLGLDAGRAGTPAWNPLGDLIAPGDRVIVKPNFVSSKDMHQKVVGERLEASSTHASLLRPILDYALRAAGPRGSVCVVDTPVEGCELDKVIGPLGVERLIREMRADHPNLDFLDLRYFAVVPRLVLDDVRKGKRSYNLGMLVRQRLPGDPRGYRIVDLGAASRLCGRAVPDEQLCFHRSHRYTPRAHHTGGRHEYALPQTVLDADVIINVPKMKTHKKTGVTLALKSVIGLTSEKYWLPHFTAGDPSVGGDEYDRPQSVGERLEARLSRFPLPGGHSLIARAPRLDRPPRPQDGSWEGNDTLWRTILDLNHAVLFSDRNGTLRTEPQRRYLTIVDGIVAGEGEGPLGATPVHAGILIGGFDPVVVDAEVSRLMGFDPDRIPQIAHGRARPLLPTSTGAATCRIDGTRPQFRFQPPRSWPSLRSPIPSAP
jgi:uncharacterized protein (DUF362 family)